MSFTAYMSVVAPAQMSRFHHVYEWGQVGDPTAKLWDDVLIGSGSVRTATFKWRASKQSVPVREDFKAKGVKADSRLCLEGSRYGVWKEYCDAPKRGKFLAYFTGPTNPESKYAMQVTQNPIQVTDPGGPMVKGSFTREYVSWWGGTGAQGVFETKLRKVLEEDLRSYAYERLRDHSEEHEIRSCFPGNCRVQRQRREQEQWLQRSFWRPAQESILRLPRLERG